MDGTCIKIKIKYLRAIFKISFILFCKLTNINHNYNKFIQYYALKINCNYALFVNLQNSKKKGTAHVLKLK
jgi:hypothetical protein